MGEKQKVLMLLESMEKELVNRDFKKTKEFIDAWRKYIACVDAKEIYRWTDESERDQVFLFELPVGNFEIEFFFSIKYIRDFYLKYPAHKQKIVFENVNGKLIHGENECCYTKIPLSEIADMYVDEKEAYVIPFPQAWYNFLVIDGNHRINRMVHDRKGEIEVMYIDYPLAARSLTGPIQICAYCLLEDFGKIKYNMDKIDHETLVLTTNIFDRKRTLNIIEERKNRANLK